MATDRHLLRHAVAAVAYRGGKALRGAPEAFGAFTAGASVRTPLEILAHIGDLFDWSTSIARDEQSWPSPTTRPWSEEVDRFHASLGRFDAVLADEMVTIPTERLDRLLQGPVADALTHVGQLTMLRRMAGSPIRGENYFVADVTTGRVGSEQPPPRREFD